MQLQMMGAFAQFERAVKRQRQLEGIAIAKDKGKYSGGIKRINRERVHQLRSEGPLQDRPNDGDISHVCSLHTQREGRLALKLIDAQHIVLAV